MRVEGKLLVVYITMCNVYVICYMLHAWIQTQIPKYKTHQTLWGTLIVA